MWLALAPLTQPPQTQYTGIRHVSSQQMTGVLIHSIRMICERTFPCTHMTTFCIVMNVIKSAAQGAGPKK